MTLSRSSHVVGPSGNGQRHRPRRQHIRPNLAVDDVDHQRMARATSTTKIGMPTSDTYTPVAGDGDKTLSATASYTDGQSATDDTVPGGRLWYK